MSKSDFFETAILQHIFQNAAIANVGDTPGLQPSASDGAIYISLHSANPGEAGSQSTNEVAYTSYARAYVVRNNTQWNVSTNIATNINAINFPTCTGGTATATWFGVGLLSSGAGNLLYIGQILHPISISSGITPSFGPGVLTVAEA